MTRFRPRLRRADRPRGRAAPGGTRAEATRLISAAAVTIDGVVATKGSTRIAERIGDRGVRTIPVDPAAIVADAVSTLWSCTRTPISWWSTSRPRRRDPGEGTARAPWCRGCGALPEMASVGEPARPGIVHRIDKEPRGSSAVARSDLGYLQLSAQIAAHAVTRRYLALVWGHPTRREG